MIRLLDTRSFGEILTSVYPAPVRSPCSLIFCKTFSTWPQSLFGRVLAPWPRLGRAQAKRADSQEEIVPYFRVYKTLFRVRIGWKMKSIGSHLTIEKRLWSLPQKQGQRHVVSQSLQSCSSLDSDGIYFFSESYILSQTRVSFLQNIHDIWLS